MSFTEEVSDHEKSPGGDSVGLRTSDGRIERDFVNGIRHRVRPNRATLGTVPGWPLLAGTCKRGPAGG